MAILHYEDSDRVPVVHFGFWGETLEKWKEEGHLTEEEASEGPAAEKLGFDMGWYASYGPNIAMQPSFGWEVVEEFPDGSEHVRNPDGVTVLRKPGATSIPMEIDHLLTDRESWEEHYKWRYQWAPERVEKSMVRTGDGERVQWDEGGLELLKKRSETQETPFGIRCGSLYGHIRNIMGMERTCYMQVDDPELMIEIIDTVGELCYQGVKYVLDAGVKFDFGHFWEDICYRSGPLVNPDYFAEHVGPHYKRITDTLRETGADLCSLDCDGKIDALVPIWLENGVNVMFPIEVGTWEASIEPWREHYGREVRGVGGMNKTVFGYDRDAVDEEIERLKPLVDLGGYIPCPDHRIAPEAQWDLVRYYCDRMHEEF
jgi:uroporphyrinogen decarboxylase